MRTLAPIFIFGLILVSLSDVDARRKRGRLKISSETVGAQVFVNEIGRQSTLKRSIRPSRTTYGSSEQARLRRLSGKCDH